MNKNKRLSVNIPINLHLYVQQLSRDDNITLTKWITRAILEKMIREGDVEVVKNSYIDEYHFF